jgi:AraC-like DNA-binding protein
MYNLYEYNLESKFRKMECDELLCVEFRCLPGDDRGGVWSQHDHIAFVVSGKKTWITPDGEYQVDKGNALYCRKGGHLVHNFYEEEFCALLFFFPDHFVKEVVQEYQYHQQKFLWADQTDTQVLEIRVDLSLKLFFDSVMSYFAPGETPSKDLLKLKFKELILQVVSGNKNPKLAAYFLSLANSESYSLKQIMQDNYLYRLSLEDFARLCHRSLSTFKRDFQELFGTSPGRWLALQRLKYARMRLLTTGENINDVAFHSGFENTPHFIRCFKKHYGSSPQQYRLQHADLPDQAKI